MQLKSWLLAITTCTLTMISTVSHSWKSPRYFRLPDVVGFNLWSAYQLEKWSRAKEYSSGKESTGSMGSIVKAAKSVWSLALCDTYLAINSKSERSSSLLFRVLDSLTTWLEHRGV